MVSFLHSTDAFLGANLLGTLSFLKKSLIALNSIQIANVSLDLVGDVTHRLSRVLLSLYV